MKISPLASKLPQIVKEHFSETLLNKHVVCVIGYGSGVFPQTQVQKHKNTIDLLMVVKETEEFHSDLLKRQRSDYSGLSSIIGSKYLSLLNQVHPIHFNHAKTAETALKYGVISLNTM